MVRLSMSTACSTAYGQNEMGALEATRCARAFSMIVLMARSATPFRECT